MVKLYDGGAYLVNGTQIITDEAEVKAKTGREVSKEEARTQTMAYGILEAHNISGNMERHLMTLHLSELFRQRELPDWRSSQFHMY